MNTETLGVRVKLKDVSRQTGNIVMRACVRACVRACADLDAVHGLLGLGHACVGGQVLV